MAPPTIDEIFQKIKEGIAKDASLVKKVKGVITFKFTSPSGMWTVDLKTGKGSVYQGKAKKKANLTLTMKAKDFVDMAQGKLNGQQAFMSGKLKMKGNMGLAMKLGNIMATVSM